MAFKKKLQHGSGGGGGEKRDENARAQWQKEM
jgi:hypothetical protein